MALIKVTEYKMSREMFDAIVKKGKKKDKPFDYVLKVVNDTFGIKGTVSRIIITD